MMLDIKTHRSSAYPKIGKDNDIKIFKIVKD